MISATARWQLLSVVTIWSATAGLILLLHWTVNEFVIDVVNDWNGNVVDQISEQANWVAVEQTAEAFLERVDYFDIYEESVRSLAHFSEELYAIDEDSFVEGALIDHLLYLVGEADEPDDFYFPVEVLIDIGEHYFWYGEPGLLEDIEQRTEEWPELEWLPDSLNADTVEVLVDRYGELIRNNEDVCVVFFDDEDDWLASNLREALAQISAVGYDLYEINGEGFRENAQTQQAIPLNCLANYIEGDGFYGFVGVESRELIQLYLTLQRIRNWGIPATFVLSLAMGLWLTRRFRKPIVALNTTIDQIRDGKLDARVPVVNSQDDLSKLAHNVNDMLASIETLLFDTRHMADNIAHDLQTPLTRLQTRLQNLQVEDENTELALGEISAEIERLQNFCRALLHLANVESEKVKSQFRPTNLSDVVTGVSDMYQPILDDLGYEFSLNLPEAPVTLLGDKTLLQQALSNCLDNCTKYVPAGERISVSLTQTNGAIELIVEDTGPGVSDDQLRLLSQRFYRAERDRATPGNGLGLALVKSIVAAHGGEMEISSREGFRLVCRF